MAIKVSLEYVNLAVYKLIIKMLQIDGARNGIFSWYHVFRFYFVLKIFNFGKGRFDSFSFTLEPHSRVVLYFNNFFFSKGNLLLILEK